MDALDQYAPSFTIIVNGKDIRNLGVDILSVSITDTCDQADSFNFTLRDRHPEPGRFAGGPTLRWMDDKLFDEGAQVEIQMGYVNNLGIEFWGLVTATSPSFPESGSPTLNVRGFSHYWILQQHHRERPFESTTDSEIATKCANELGLSPVVDAIQIKHALVSPNNATYAAFLSERARRIGYELVVKKRVMYFQQPPYLVGHEPAVTLEWGRNLRSFSPNLSLYEPVTEVESRGPQTSHGKGKTPLVGKAGAGEERFKMGGQSASQIAKDAGKKKHVIIQDHNIVNQEEANLLALAQLESRSLNFISGRGSCTGNPQLTARVLIALKGLGQRFSGLYYVTSVTHTIDIGGYRTDFEARRNGR